MYHLIRLSGIQAATSNEYNLCLLSVLTIMQEPFPQKQTNIKQTNRKPHKAQKCWLMHGGNLKGFKSSGGVCVRVCMCVCLCMCVYAVKRSN